MKIVNYILLTIGIVGAINWGFIGLLDFNLVSFLFGSDSSLTRLVYIVVGISGLYMLSLYSKLHRDR